MPQLFPKQANGLSQASIAVAAAAGGTVLLALFLLARSGYATGQGTPYDQPVPFSHNHHTTGVGIAAVTATPPLKRRPRLRFPLPRPA